MKSIKKMGALLFCVLLAPLAAAQTASPQPPKRLQLESSAFQDGGVIPNEFTAASPDPVSPPLNWKNAPAGTVSFALILHDPGEAPNHNSADFLHWMVFNIPGNATSLPQNLPHTAQLANGTIQALNRRRVPGYMGPGARFVYHDYTFELYALDTKLALGSTASRQQLLAAMDGHVIAKAALVGRFHR